MKKEPVIILSPIRILKELNNQELRIQSSDYENMVTIVQKRKVSYISLINDPEHVIMRETLLGSVQITKDIFDKIMKEYENKESDYIYVEYFNGIRLLLSEMKIPYVLLFPPKEFIQEYNDSIPRDLPVNIFAYNNRWAYREITKKEEKEFEEETFACKMRLGESYLPCCYSPHHITIQTMEQIRSIFLYTLNDSKLFEEYE